jgi:hypothetical protein
MAPPRLSGKNWPRIRHDYEQTEKPIHTICAQYRISPSTLRNRVRQWGWTERVPRVPAEGPPPEPLPQRDAPALAEPSESLPPPPAAPVEARQIAHRLRGAIDRVVAAIDLALAGLSAASSPREIERAGRAVAALTRTLHELNAMLTQFPMPERDENDEFFRAELEKLERMSVVNDAYRRGILRDT